MSVCNNLGMIPFGNVCRVKWQELGTKFCRKYGGKLRELDVPRPAILSADSRLFLS
jgi:hypothetical protein